jgi:hypothetical protein
MYATVGDRHRDVVANRIPGAIEQPRVEKDRGALGGWRVGEPARE